MDREETREDHRPESVDHINMAAVVSVDWRGRPCKANKHGGMTAALFVLGLSHSLSFLLLCFFNPQHTHTQYSMNINYISSLLVGLYCSSSS